MAAYSGSISVANTGNLHFSLNSETMSTTPLLKLRNTLSQQIKLAQDLEQQLKDIKTSSTNDWRMVMKQYLSDIRNHIEELRDRQTQLENNKLLLKNKIFHLNQEIQELTVSRRKLSPTNIHPIYKTATKKPQLIPITTCTTFLTPHELPLTIHPVNISHINPMVMPKPESPIPIERITGPQSAFTYKNWKFESLKNPMADSNEIQSISETLGIKTLPEMVFPHSYLNVTLPNSLELQFDAVNGLKPCIGEPPKNKRVEVQYAKEWKNKAKNSKDVEQLRYDYDWTYTSNYKGDYKAVKGGKVNIEHDVKDRFNMVMLRDTTVPIVWSCHCILYEDELSDNGMSQLLVRCRVMPTGFLILLRYWLRVDNVIIRVNDTRIFHEFGTNFVLRHFEERESKWSKLKKKYPATQVMQFSDPNQFSNKIDILHTVYDKIFL
eukprot:310051_1